MEELVRERGRLFVRPETPRPITIGARQIVILTNLARFGIASSAQLAKLDGGSEQNVSRELAVARRPELALLSRRIILEDAPKTRRDRRVRLTASVRLDGVQHRLSVDPDELFGLRFVQDEEELYFMYEKDRGEMPVERYKSKQQTYYLKKMLTYHAANRQGIHTQDLGIPNFRVLTDTTTVSRVDEMVAAVMRMTDGKGSNMFLFIDQAQLAASNPLDALWTTGKGDKLRLTD